MWCARLMELAILPLNLLALLGFLPLTNALIRPLFDGFDG